MSKIIIRKADKDDINDLAELLSELFELEKDFTADIDTQIRGLSMIISNPASIVLLAEDVNNSKTVGMCTMQILVSTAQGSKSGHIEDVIITKERRGEGIGKLLLKAVIDIAKKEGCTRLQLSADNNNTPAHGFYKKLGWNQTNLSVWFYKMAN